MPNHDPSSAPPPPPRYGLIVAAIAAGAIIGFAGVYGIGTMQRNAPQMPAASGAPATGAAADPACAGTAKLAEKLAPLNRGEVAAIALAKSPNKLPELTFFDDAGQQRQLSQWRGRTILLNLWATWCVPCRLEMPALDALQAKLGGPDFEVVAVNIDTRDPAKPKAWLGEAGIKTLTYYHDDKARIFQDLKTIGKAFGMPTTLLIDPKGCEIGTLAGPAEWASEDAIKLIGAAIAGSKNNQP